MTMPMPHPDELLADYVDDLLDADDRARAERHLAECHACRQEVALAREARIALATLPELDAPPGATHAVLQRARAPRRWSPALAWGAAAAAAAAAFLGAFLLFGPNRAPDQAMLRGPTAGAGGEAAPQEAEDETGALMGGDSVYPTFHRSTASRDAADVQALASRLVDEAHAALDDGFPEPATAFYQRFAVAKHPERLQVALECVAQGAAPDRSLAPFWVEASAFEGDPAYIAGFLQAATPTSPYTHLVVYVVDSRSCTLRHFARQNL